MVTDNISLHTYIDTLWYAVQLFVNLLTKYMQQNPSYGGGGTVPQLIRKARTFYGTQSFIIMFTTACQ
jgi:hypothetical protein